MRRERLKEDLQQIFRAAIDAVDPEAAVRRAASRSGDLLRLDGLELNLSDFGRVRLVGAGKGAAPMVRAVEELLGERLEAGVAVVKEGHGLPASRTRILEAAHPVPDARGVTAAEEMLAFVGELTPDDLLVCVLTGGASAVLVAPHPPLTLAEKTCFNAGQFSTPATGRPSSTTATLMHQVS